MAEQINSDWFARFTCEVERAETVYRDDEARKQLEIDALKATVATYWGKLINQLPEQIITAISERRSLEPVITCRMDVQDTSRYEAARTSKAIFIKIPSDAIPATGRLVDYMPDLVTLGNDVRTVIKRVQEFKRIHFYIILKCQDDMLSLWVSFCLCPKPAEECMEDLLVFIDHKNNKHYLYY
jgi:hypothetical protein